MRSHCSTTADLSSQIIDSELEKKSVAWIGVRSDLRLRGWYKTVKLHNHLRALVRSVSLRDHHSLDQRIWDMLPTLLSLGTQRSSGSSTRVHSNLPVVLFV
jgi:hypothetical protein